MVRPSMEPFEKVREDCEWKGGGRGVEGLIGLRTTIIRLSTCSSVNELAPFGLASKDKLRVYREGIPGAKSGTAADSGVCVTEASLMFPFAITKGAGADGTKGAAMPSEGMY